MIFQKKLLNRPAEVHAVNRWEQFLMAFERDKNKENFAVRGLDQSMHLSTKNTTSSEIVNKTSKSTGGRVDGSEQTLNTRPINAPWRL